MFHENISPLAHLAELIAGQKLSISVLTDAAVSVFAPQCIWGMARHGRVHLSIISQDELLGAACHDTIVTLPHWYRAELTRQDYTGLPTVDAIVAQILKKRHLTWFSRTADTSVVCVTEQFAYFKHIAYSWVVKNHTATTLLPEYRASR